MFSTDLLLCMGFYKWVNSRLFQRFLFVFNIYSQKKNWTFCRQQNIIKHTNVLKRIISNTIKLKIIITSISRGIENHFYILFIINKLQR